MLVAAFWLLLAAALGGLFMAGLDAAMRPVRMGHGAIAALGLLALLIGALMQPSILAWTAFGVLAIGFGGGAVLFGIVWHDDAPPRSAVIAHGGLNAFGLVLLGVAAFG